MNVLREMILHKHSCIGSFFANHKSIEWRDDLREKGIINTEKAVIVRHCSTAHDPGLLNLLYST